jgi:hypothetical protein
MNDNTQEFTSVEDITETKAMPLDSAAGATDIGNAAAVADFADAMEYADDVTASAAGDVAAPAPEDATDTAATPAATLAAEDAGYTQDAAHSHPIGEASHSAGPIPMADDVPLYESTVPRPMASQPSIGTPVPEPKKGVSTPTIIFGLLGVLIGVIGLAFGVVFPNSLIPAFASDPQVLVAITCAAVGVVLVIVAIVWAVLGAVRGKNN